MKLQQAHTYIEIDALGKDDISLGDISEQTCVVTNVGSLSAGVTIAAIPATLSELSLPGCQASRLTLEGDIRLNLLAIDSTSSDARIELWSSSSIDCEVLDLRDVAVELLPLVHGLSALRLGNAELLLDRQSHVQELEVVGRVTVRTRGFSASSTVLPRRRATVEVHGEYASFGDVASDGSRVSLTLEGSEATPIRIASLPAQSVVQLNGANVDFATPQYRDGEPSSFSSPHICGRGTVSVRSRMDFPRFDPGPEGRIAVLVRPDGKIYKGAGEIELSQAVGAVITGNRGRRPLAVTRVGDVTDAELLQISLYGLEDPGCIQALRRARRVVPWIPSALRARQLQGTQTLGAPINSGRYRWERNHTLWADLVEILQNDQGNGAIQADARVHRMRARKRALSPRSNPIEWLLLSAYALFGYGERITTPLLVWGGFVSACFVALTRAGHVRIAGGSANLHIELMSPLHVLDALRSQPIPMPAWCQLLMSVCQSAGFLLVGMSAMAARRMLRPKKN
jgi:hypothetical protein